MIATLLIISLSLNIVLSIEEAKQLKEALDDYAYICSNKCGYGETNDQTEKLASKLDETILKSETE